jgi:adenine phosphoribosyltransferase
VVNLKSQIREIPDWPKKGINFKDITPLLQDPVTFRQAVNKLAEPFAGKVDKVVGIDARGFLLAAPVAYKLKAGLCLVRKKDKLPFRTFEETYLKEYGEDILAIHCDTIEAGEKVLIVDDVLATGGTMSAAVTLVEKLGGKVAGISILIDLPFLGGSRKLKKYTINSLISYDHE